jgi:hypothetical protein
MQRAPIFPVKCRPAGDASRPLARSFGRMLNVLIMFDQCFNSVVMGLVACTGLP